MQSNLGFSLFELLIALSIAAILLTISLSGLQHFYAAANDKVVQEQLLQAIDSALQEAEIRHMPIVMKKRKSAWLNGMIIFVNENKDGVMQDREEIISIVQFQTQQGKLHWRAFPFYRDYILFLPSGLMRTDNSLFWYCRNKPIWAIGLSKTGRTRIILPNKNGEIKDAHGKVLGC